MAGFANKVGGFSWFHHLVCTKN